MFTYLSCSIKRRRTANLITAGISLLLVLLMNLYFGSIRSYQKQLVDLAQNIPIICQITNLNGNLWNGLFIPERIVDDLQQSAHVKDLSYMTVMLAGEGDFKEVEYSKYLNLYVVGANKAEIVGELSDDMISMDRDSVDELLSSDKMECIVNENVLKRRGWKIGDKILLKCYYYDPASEFNKIQIHSMGSAVEIKIVATMEDIKEKTNAIATDIIIPAKTARNIFGISGLPFFADTVTFHVKDPFYLNTFKEDMLKIGLQETSPEAADSYTGCALTVRDSNFISSATDLRRAIEVMRSFFPAVCILILMIGYVVSFLSGNSRRDEFALLRLQGVKNRNASLLFLTEQMLLVLAGNFLGDMIMLWMTPSLTTLLAVNAVLSVSYLIGAAAAYGQMSRRSLLYLLSAQK